MSAADWRDIEIVFDLEKMLTLLARSLYPRPDAAVRELLANAVDALVRRKASIASGNPGWAGATDDLHVMVNYDRVQRNLVVSDNGIGMTEADIEEYVNRIGRSGTDLRARQELPRDLAKQLIGEFGIGLLACFKLGSTVSIRTRSALDGDAPGIEWEARGGPRARMRPTDGIREPGTTVTVYVEDQENHELLAERLEVLVRHYGDLLPFPIRDPIGEQLNSFGRVPWRTGQASDQTALAAYMAERAKPELINPPLWTVPIEPHGSPAVDMHGVIVIPDDPNFLNPRGGLDLYVRSMLVRRDCEDVLPKNWLFCHGAVDCADLNMILNKDDVARDSQFRDFQAALRSQILRGLQSLAGHPADFNRVQARFDSEIKWAMLHDRELFDMFAPHLQFYVSSGEERMSLGTYCQEAERRENQALRKTVYYLAAASSPIARYPIDQVLVRRRLRAIEIHHRPTGSATLADLDREILERYCSTYGYELVPAERLLDEFTQQSDPRWRRVVELFERVLLRNRIRAEVMATELDTATLPVFLQSTSNPTIEAKVEAAIQQFQHFQQVHPGAVPPGFAAMVDRAVRAQALQAHSVKVILNTSNDLMQTFCDVVSDQAFQARDPQQEMQHLVAAELYNLAYQYSGFLPNETALQGIIENRCQLIRKLLVQ